MIILYTTGCEKCVKLKKMLDEVGLSPVVIDDIPTMLSKGYTKVPMMVEDGVEYGYFEAIQYIKRYKERLNEVQNNF